MSSFYQLRQHFARDGTGKIANFGADNLRTGQVVTMDGIIITPKLDEALFLLAKGAFDKGRATKGDVYCKWNGDLRDRIAFLFMTYLGKDYKAFSYMNGMAGVLSRGNGPRRKRADLGSRSSGGGCGTRSRCAFSIGSSRSSTG
jgi:hypothetical protein